ncbi:uncharacterized protein LOC111065300 [Drosophila obscura]|uniref:uncharacterized protein LOC111065300 n=1 Tax=Drosophila obscura TaxID=7282 RepID=UPI001BB258A9|nr:uncharacterized protein LOC111065300 [Drosophila obscura]
MSVAGNYDSVHYSAHFNFIQDFRETFANDGLCAMELINNAADAWQGLTRIEKNKFERKQYLAARKDELNRVKNGESMSVLWEQQKKEFRELALRGQSNYRVKYGEVKFRWGNNNFEGDGDQFNGDGDQFKGDDSSLFKNKSCLCSILGMFLGKCRSKQHAPK